METANIRLKEIKEGAKILKPNYHLNFGKMRIFKMDFGGYKFTTLGDLCDSIYSGGIFKRVFVDTLDSGIPYISAQYMMNYNPIEFSKLISKKYTPRQEDMTLRTNQILVSCAGTVGNVRLITKDLDGVIGSQDIIRVIPNQYKAPFGFIYAYLSSPTAFNYIQSFIYGSVVPRIDPATLSKLPVPIFDEAKQKDIHNLIMQTSKLRVEANILLKNVIENIENNYSIDEKKNIYRVNIREINKGDKYTNELRMGAEFYQHQINQLIDNIKRNNWFFLGDLSNTIQRSSIRQRCFVEQGIPLITGQDLNLYNLKDVKMISKKFTRNINKNMTHERDILISIQGTIGKVEYTYNNIYQNVFASDKLAKLSIKSDLVHPGYIYAFLKSKMGQIQLLKFKTGSVIDAISENNIASVVIPIPKDKGHSIGKEIEKATVLRQEAYVCEKRAIQIIENEIDSWQN